MSYYCSSIIEEIYLIIQVINSRSEYESNVNKTIIKTVNFYNYFKITIYAHVSLKYRNIMSITEMHIFYLITY